MTWARNEAASFGGSCFESPQTLPRRMSLTDTGEVRASDARRRRTVLDVEADVVSGQALGQGLVVHLQGQQGFAEGATDLDRLDLGGDVGRGEGDDHAGLDDTAATCQ